MIGDNPGAAGEDAGGEKKEGKIIWCVKNIGFQ